MDKQKSSVLIEFKINAEIFNPIYSPRPLNSRSIRVKASAYKRANVGPHAHYE